MPSLLESAPPLEVPPYKTSDYEPDIDLILSKFPVIRISRMMQGLLHIQAYWKYARTSACGSNEILLIDNPDIMVTILYLPWTPK